MTKRIRLLTDWAYDGENYKAGVVLDVDEGTAKALIADGTGALEDDGTTKTVKTVDQEPVSKTTNDQAADTVVIKRADYDALIKGTVDKDAGDGKDTKANGRPRIGRVHDNILDDENRGYPKIQNGGLGVFLQEVAKAANPERDLPVPDRLKACKNVGSDEYATVEDAIGGYLIPPAHDPGILQKGVETPWIRENGARVIPIPSTMWRTTAITDETRTSTLYGGIQCYWLKERGQMTATKGEYQKVELKPTALTAMAYATDAELNYAPVLQAIIGMQFQDSMTYKEHAAFIGGDGAGEPLGILNAGCVYSQAAETGPTQAAATIVTENVIKMRSHMRPQEYIRAVWYASLSCMEQLNLMTIDVGTGGAPIAMVNITADGVERLLGRPLIYTEFAEAIGTVGDLVLASWPTYLIGEGTYSNAASSIHVRFDYNETAFRFVKQIDGQPWWRTTLTLKNSWEVAPFVTLAARA